MNILNLMIQNLVNSKQEINNEKNQYNNIYLKKTITRIIKVQENLYSPEP